MSQWRRSAQQILQRRTPRFRELAAFTLFFFSPGTLLAEVGHAGTDSGAKGTIGLGLLGAETVLTVEAALGVKRWWLYAIGGTAGAVGGAIGGHYIDKGENAELSMALLVSGMLFAVPTTIAVLNASQFRPAQNPVIDNGLNSSDQKDSKSASYRGMLPPSLLDVDPLGQVHLQIPAVKVSQVFSKLTRQIHSVPSATAVTVPVFSLTF